MVCVEGMLVSAVYPVSRMETDHLKLHGADLGGNVCKQKEDRRKEVKA